MRYMADRSRFDTGEQAITIEEYYRRYGQCDGGVEGDVGEAQEDIDPVEELRRREGSQTRRWQDMTGERVVEAEPPAPTKRRLVRIGSSRA